MNIRLDSVNARILESLVEDLCRAIADVRSGAGAADFEPDDPSWLPLGRIHDIKAGAFFNRGEMLAAVGELRVQRRRVASMKAALAHRREGGSVAAQSSPAAAAGESSPAPAPGARPIAATFGDGGLPYIACINKATVPFGDFAALVAALQQYVDECVVPVWGTPAKLIAATDFVPGAWGLQFTDTADVAGALGYHDLTPDGLPLGHVFVKTTLDDKEIVSVTASHELVEMLIDPGIQMCVCDPKNVIYAYEAADAVEETFFLVAGVQMSNFVFPAWFESFHADGSVPFDHMGLCKSPFQILAGGYMSVLGKRGWKQIFGSSLAGREFRFADRRLHRSERRGRRNDAASVG